MRILVVEDNLINQQVAEELLNSEGALVSLAANGQQGVEAVAAAMPQFDAVLMDIQMPVMDGYAATREIRGRLGLASLPVIAMTANAMASDREVCLSAGMDDHVGKPFDLSQLVNLLLRLTGYQHTQSVFLDSVPASDASNLLVASPELDVPSALTRMSGLKSLYLRAARDFSKALASVVAQYRSSVEAGALDLAAIQMHTLKGTAGTLGANLLSQEAGRLEKLCKTPEGVATALGQAEGLDALVQAVRVALDAAVVQLDETAAPSPEPATPVLDVKAARAALEQLNALLTAADMSALDVHAQLRPVLAALPAEPLEELESALQDLDFDTAQQTCKGLLVQLANPA
jgi:CheY-like chemotaxis protein